MWDASRSRDQVGIGHQSERGRIARRGKPARALLDRRSTGKRIVVPAPAVVRWCPVLAGCLCPRRRCPQPNTNIAGDIGPASGDNQGPRSGPDSEQSSSFLPPYAIVIVAVVSPIVKGDTTRSTW